MQQDNYSILDTLLYLFDHIIYEQKGNASLNEMQQTLNEAGFTEKTINRALDWFVDLNDIQQNHHFLQLPSQQSIRWFSAAEKQKISVESRGFINKLTQMHVIDAPLRETIIAKLMTLDESKLLLEDVMWVALMSLYHRQDKVADREWLSHLLSDEISPAVFH
ncbi:DUF494 domain-containing protein [Ostreibacterium oceani]|uniref:Protein Smg homolog n=1 Tax=Ostreibacterium oceani TaxID=2654998 RepID=A0A6N7EW77_9GAMM|nr:DUF494 domain-containing protein [Ostreibacterium oceani]MPV86153.1 DUF494 family protein [Ostreibacterium oceani]